MGGRWSPRPVVARHYPRMCRLKPASTIRGPCTRVPDRSSARARPHSRDGRRRVHGGSTLAARRPPALARRPRRVRACASCRRRPATRTAGSRRSSRRSRAATASRAACGSSAPRSGPAEHLAEQDVIYVSGGNTANALAVWRLHGVDVALRDAWERGAVLGGVSAGANCWFECCVTDSFGAALGPLHDGLGLLPGSFCPHYDGEELRRPVYRDAGRRRIPGRIRGRRRRGRSTSSARSCVEVVASHPGARAYRVERRRRDAARDQALCEAGRRHRVGERKRRRRPSDGARRRASTSPSTSSTPCTMARTGRSRPQRSCGRGSSRSSRSDSVGRSTASTGASSAISCSEHADVVVWLDLPLRVWLPRLVRRTARRIATARGTLERQPRGAAVRLPSARTRSSCTRFATFATGDVATPSSSRASPSCAFARRPRSTRFLSEPPSARPELGEPRRPRAARARSASGARRRRGRRGT